MDAIGGEDAQVENIQTQSNVRSSENKITGGVCQESTKHGNGDSVGLEAGKEKEAVEGE